MGKYKRSGQIRLLDDVLPKIVLPRLELPELFPKSFLQDVARIGESMRLMTEQVTAAVSPAIEIFKEIGANINRSKRIEASGWLPHYTTPFSLIRDDMAVEEIAVVIEKHYKENWCDIEAAFVERLEKIALDDEAKATFIEALTAHRHGLYRSVPRTLFPEIERVACKELYDGSRKYKKENPKGGKPHELSITSLPDFAETVGELPVGDVMTIDYGVALFMKLEEHLYKGVKQPEEIAKAAADAVPNRHAALHGIISYSTLQSSINALIMTDFIFHVISQIRLRSAGEKQIDSGDSKPE